MHHNRNIVAAASPIIVCDPVPAEFEAEAPTADGKKKNARNFSMIAYTGGAMRLRFWDLPVVIDIAGMEVGATPRPIYVNHDTQNIDALLGQTTEITKTAAGIAVKGVAIRSETSKASQRVFELHEAGFKFQASVGALPTRTERVEAGKTVTVNGRQFAGPLYVARTSTLSEISFVPLGADDRTSAQIAAASKGMKMKTVQNGIVVGDPTDSTIDAADPNDPVAVERARVTAINKLACMAEFNSADCRKVISAAIADGTSVNETELKLLRAERTSKTAPPMIGGGAVGGIGDQTLIVAAACLAVGIPEKSVAADVPESARERVMNAALSREWRNVRIGTICRHVLHAAGRPANFDRITPDVIRDTFEAGRYMQASQFSTLSLPGILSAVANKTMLETYAMVPTTWPQFCIVTDGVDFKPMKRYRLTGKHEFKEVPPGGDIEHVGLAESEYSNQLKTEGSILSFTRQMLINDDLSSLQSGPKLLARMGAIKLEEEIYTLLLANTGNFFHADNHNYIEGAGTALSIDSLSQIEATFYSQTDVNGKPAMIGLPSRLLVPPALTAKASALVSSTEIRDTTTTTKYPTGNPHEGRFKAVTSPWLKAGLLTGGSDTAFYLFADVAGGVAVIEVAFLNGRKVPTVETADADFSTLGVMMRAYHDWGIAFQDPKAGVKSKGAA